tara:strand:- start:35165 stop:35635 length:471 start_codon:yes stop_codon:yes gene_type:complete
MSELSDIGAPIETARPKGAWQPRPPRATTSTNPSNRELAEELADALQLETPLARHCLALAIGNIRTLDAKQVDYGPDNLTRHGRLGILVRLDDKASRLGTLLKRDASLESTQSLELGTSKLVSPNYESRLDSWLDAANYALIGAALETAVDLKNPS